MKIDVLTIFPKMLETMDLSIVGKAKAAGKLVLEGHDFREFAKNKQRHVDDYPYGGNTAGMLLTPQPIFDCVESIEVDAAHPPRVILMDPAGVQFTQGKAEELAKEEHLIFLCGRYEGFDERIRSLVTDEISIGDYILTGGELGAMVVIDAVSRLLPDVLGNAESHQTDSFSSGLLEEPQYTRPQDFRGMKVPDVLMSGDHEKIRLWRMKESLRRTYLRRPELLETVVLTFEQEQLLGEVKEES